MLTNVSVLSGFSVLSVFSITQRPFTLSTMRLTAT
jgi:hypothetical protein